MFNRISSIDAQLCNHGIIHVDNAVDTG